MLEFGRSQIVYTKREGDFASVMEIMLNDVPDDPLARDSIRPTPPYAFKDVL
jgi:hypothetical protein